MKGEEDSAAGAGGVNSTTEDEAKKECCWHLLSLVRVANLLLEMDTMLQQRLSKY